MELRADLFHIARSCGLAGALRREEAMAALCILFRLPAAALLSDDGSLVSLFSGRDAPVGPVVKGTQRFAP